MRKGLLKTIGALALLGGAGGGATIAAVVIGAQHQTAQVGQEQPNNAAAPTAALPNPPASYEGSDPSATNENDGFGKDYTDYADLANEAYKLSPAYRAEEQSYYEISAVDRQLQKIVAGLNDRRIVYNDELLGAVANMVQAFDASNSDNVVAWRSTQRFTGSGKETAGIYMEGGPLTNPVPSRVTAWGWSIKYWRMFLLKQAQFHMLPSQLVGQQGVMAANNKYMSRLRSSDPQRLAYYKQMYERGALSNAKLLWALAGSLDLTQTQLYFVFAAAAIIVNTARLSALTDHLHAANYGNVSLAGISYGMNAGMYAVLNDPSLLDRLYQVSLGESVFTNKAKTNPGTALPDKALLDDQSGAVNWDLSMVMLDLTYDTAPWMKSVLRPDPNAAPVKDLSNLFWHVANDDDHGWTNQMYVDQGNLAAAIGMNQTTNYKRYASGGHSVWGKTDAELAALVGLTARQVQYSLR